MVTIQVDDDVAAVLHARASTKGLSIDELLKATFLPSEDPAERMSIEEFDRILDELATDGPSPSGTFSREDLYSDHD
jgi:hypothetical protein